MKEFAKKIEVLKLLVNRYILPVLGLAIIALFSFGFGGWGLGLTMLFLAALSMNFLWFVPTGEGGYKRVLSKLCNKSYKDGIHFKIPYITDTNTMSVQPEPKVLRDTKKVLTRNNVEIEYTLTYTVNPCYVHLLIKHFGEDWLNKCIRWADAPFDTFVGRLTYPQFQSQKEVVEKIASAFVFQEIDAKCSEKSKAEGTHVVHHYDFKDDETITIDINGDGIEEEVAKLELIEVDEEEVLGINFFSGFEVKINKVTFETRYEEAQSKVIVAKAEKDEAKLKGEAAVILAEKQADVIKIKATAEAEALKAKGAAENEVKRVLGEVLNSHPELLKEQLAKNFPKVFGGANPMINLEDMLKGGE